MLSVKQETVPRRPSSLRDEINEALGEQTAEVFRKAGFRDVSVVKDLSDRDRFVEFYG